MSKKIEGGPVVKVAVGKGEVGLTGKPLARPWQNFVPEEQEARSEQVVVAPKPWMNAFSEKQRLQMECDKAGANLRAMLKEREAAERGLAELQKERKRVGKGESGESLEGKLAKAEERLARAALAVERCEGMQVEADEALAVEVKREALREKAKEFAEEKAEEKEKKITN